MDIENLWKRLREMGIYNRNAKYLKERMRFAAQWLAFQDEVDIRNRDMKQVYDMLSRAEANKKERQMVFLVHGVNSLFAAVGRSERVDLYQLQDLALGTTMSQPELDWMRQQNSQDVSWYPQFKLSLIHI